MPVVTTVFDSTEFLNFARLTTENVGRRFAIVFWMVGFICPKYANPSRWSWSNFCGFTLQKRVAVLLCGTLPAPLRVEERSVGASLGAIQLNIKGCNRCYICYDIYVISLS